MGSLSPARRRRPTSLAFSRRPFPPFPFPFPSSPSAAPPVSSEEEEEEEEEAKKIGWARAQPAPAGKTPQGPPTTEEDIELASETYKASPLPTAARSADAEEEDDDDEEEALAEEEEKAAAAAARGSPAPATAGGSAPLTTSAFAFASFFSSPRARTATVQQLALRRRA